MENVKNEVECMLRDADEITKKAAKDFLAVFVDAYEKGRNAERGRWENKGDGTQMKN